MPTIGFDTVDFEYLSNDIDNINAKIDNLMGYICGNFTNEQNKELFNNGFNNMVVYLNSEKERLNKTKATILAYKEAMNDVEEVYKKEFSNLNVPSVVYRAIEPKPLVVEVPKTSVTPVSISSPSSSSSTYVEPSVSGGAVTNENLNNPTNDNNNDTNSSDNNDNNSTIQESVINNPSNDDSNNNNNYDNSNNNNNDVETLPNINQNTTNNEKTEENNKSSNLGNIGLIAGAIGAVGLAGAGAAVAIKKSKDKDDEDSERDY